MTDNTSFNKKKLFHFVLRLFMSRIHIPFLIMPDLFISSLFIYCSSKCLWQVQQWADTNSDALRPSLRHSNKHTQLVKGILVSHFAEALSFSQAGCGAWATHDKPWSWDAEDDFASFPAHSCSSRLTANDIKICSIKVNFSYWGLIFLLHNFRLARMYLNCTASCESLLHGVIHSAICHGFTMPTINHTHKHISPLPKARLWEILGKGSRPENILFSLSPSLPPSHYPFSLMSHSSLFPRATREQCIACCLW